MSIRRYVSALLVIMIAVTFLLTGCQSADVPTHPLDALDIPETGYEKSFSPVESAVLYVGETQQTIDPDDPRLMHVLNLLVMRRKQGSMSVPKAFFPRRKSTSIALTAKLCLRCSLQQIRKIAANSAIPRKYGFVQTHIFSI